ncbi:MAG: alcohol dehydrogenase catalytic domain-containing protein [Chthonomonadales bacterium]|nr:alcohol dehydrogenase catalytic domain-containing protein [Chthonomonadales bacterium]
MRQAVLTAPGELEIRDVPAPRPGAGEVLLRVRRIGVCGSDVHVFHGTHPYTPYPVVQGHELMATVEALGPGASGLQPGQPVTALPQIVCGECAPCRRGDWHICESLKVRGFQAPGCAQDLFVTSAWNVVPLPTGFTPEQGALVEPVAVAVHAVGRAPALAGRAVAVLGAGPIGNLVAQVARGEGARVLVTDLSDDRLEVARRCGVEAVSHAGREPLREAARRVFGSDGVEVAFECAGAEASVGAAISTIGKGGTIVIVAVFGQRPRVDLGLVQDRELSLVGTLMYRHGDYERAIGLIRSDAVATGPLVSAHFAFERYADAYRYIDEHGDRCVKVMVDVG